MSKPKNSEGSKILFHERRHQEAPKELELMKQEAFDAFMRHPAAMEEDFERLWPLIRDELWIQFVVNHMLRKGG